MPKFRESKDYFWEEDKFLGQGTYGTVYEGKNKKNGSPVAVKVLNYSSLSRSPENRMREFEILMNLNHENVVKCFSIEKYNSSGIVIIMEICVGGSLAKNLDEPENKFGLQEDEFILFLSHLKNGVKYLRDNNIAHRDLKPNNILKYIKEDGTNIYKLADFDSARVLEDDQEFTSLFGTEEYLHPDVYQQAVLNPSLNLKFTASVDLWSIGCTLYNVLTGLLPFRPFGGKENRQAMNFITTKKESGVISGVQLESKHGPIQWEKELPISTNLCSSFKSLITPLLAGLVEVDVDKKLSFQDFFKNVDEILSRKPIDILYLNQFRLFRIHLNTNECKSFRDFQELLFKETEVPVETQMLYFKNESLSSFLERKCKNLNENARVEENSIIATRKLPITSEKEPIILINKNDYNITYEQTKRDKFVERLKLSLFPNTIVPAQDSQVAKESAGVSHERKRQIERIFNFISLIKYSVQTINYVVINQLEKAFKECNQLNSRIHSFELQFNLMDTFNECCQEIYNAVKINIKDDQTNEILNSLNDSYQAQKNSFQKITDNLKELNPLINRILENRRVNSSLQQKWENDSAPIFEANDFKKNNIQASNIISKVNQSFSIIENCLKNGWGSEKNDKIVYLIERIAFQNHNQKIENLFKTESKYFQNILMIFTDWYVSAQAAFIQPEILMNGIGKIKKDLDEIEKIETEVVKKYHSTMIKFKDSLIDCVKNEKDVIFKTQPQSNSKNERRDAKMQELKKQVSDLTDSQIKLKGDFEETLYVCNQFQNLLEMSIMQH